MRSFLLEDSEETMNAYIDFVGGIGMRRHYLTDIELREIGRFTRENILKWFHSDRHTTPKTNDWAGWLPLFDWVGMLPVQDFHAVCGDIDIPWATEEAKQMWERTQELAGLKATTKTAYVLQDMGSGTLIEHDEMTPQEAGERNLHLSRESGNRMKRWMKEGEAK
jgi:hypothetical protein